MDSPGKGTGVGSRALLQGIFLIQGLILHLLHLPQWQAESLPLMPPGKPYAAKSHQSCLTLWDPIDGSPTGSSVPGILQARTLEWVAISFSNAWKWKVKVKLLSHVWLLATLWTVAYQAPPSMGFSRQECWSGLPLPSLGSPIKDPKLPKTSWERTKLKVSCSLTPNYILQSHSNQNSMVLIQK